MLVAQDSLAPMLSETSIIKTFLDAHTYSPGQTPKSFYLWSIMTTLAAVVRDRFYFYKFPTNPTIPNLYTFLVAPSGVGKGTAINSAADYLRPYKDYLRMFIGRATYASWLKYVTTPRGPCELDNGSDPSIVKTPGFLVSEELAFSLGEGRLASEFIKMMTQAYTQTGRSLEEMTNVGGHHDISNPCWNWLAGTTDTWLLESIGMSNILSGFASRTVWVIEDCDVGKMCSWFVPPPHFVEKQIEIAGRIEELLVNPGGELILSPGARFNLDRWWATWQARAREDVDRALLPLYARGHDLAIKIGIILRVADFDPRDPYRYAIKSEEALQACAWVDNLMLVHYPRLLRIAYKSKDAEVEKIDEVAELIQGFQIGGCTRTALMKKAHGKGLSAKVVDAALRALMEQKKVEIVPGLGNKGGYFLWVGDGKGKKEEGKEEERC